MARGRPIKPEFPTLMINVGGVLRDVSPADAAVSAGLSWQRFRQLTRGDGYPSVHSLAALAVEYSAELSEVAVVVRDVAEFQHVLQETADWMTRHRDAESTLSASARRIAQAAAATPVAAPVADASAVPLGLRACDASNGFRPAGEQEMAIWAEYFDDEELYGVIHETGSFGWILVNNKTDHLLIRDRHDPAAQRVLEHLQVPQGMRRNGIYIAPYRWIQGAS